MCRPLCRKTWNFDWVKSLWILWSFTQTINVNNIYSSNSGENVWLNKHVFNHKLFDLYNLSGHNKELYAVNANLKFTEIFNLLQSFGSRHLQTHRSLSFDTIVSSLFATLWALSRFLCCVWLNLQSSSSIYRQTEIASPWIYWLNIKDCNNYLPKNLASGN